MMLRMTTSYKPSSAENIIYILVMQRFLVVYRGISHESLVLSWYTHEPLGECVYQEKGLHNYFVPCRRKYSGQQSTMGRLGVIPLNCTGRWEGSY